ncbi:MAG: cytochrome c-type biogenesis protein CcmH [Gammaproteobacteria bacterium]|nr:cytochrome c-type biogenesis protein CcmH [Gammaproteobacteria bacterium]
MALLLLPWVLMLGSGNVSGVVFEPREFLSQDQEQRYKQLIAELRCLVCQNQNLADSGAELATDLRNEVYKMILAGDTDTQIVAFMVARYGDFVLYRPPLKLVTVGLWVGPLLLIALGLLLLYQTRRRFRSDAAANLSDAERARLNELLTPTAMDAHSDLRPSSNTPPTT